jgi:hypothetical protein
VDRAGPFEDGGDPQAVERGLTVMALIDLDAGDGMAMTGEPCSLSPSCRKNLF